MVNNFILTTDEDGNPACFRSCISTSSGQGLFFELVIMAMTLWPITLLNSEAWERTRAGRRFVFVRSVKGNGTATTENPISFPFIDSYKPLRHFRCSTL